MSKREYGTNIILNMWKNQTNIDLEIMKKLIYRKIELNLEKNSI